MDVNCDERDVVCRHNTRRELADHINETDRKAELMSDGDADCISASESSDLMALYKLVFNFNFNFTGATYRPATLCGIFDCMTLLRWLNRAEAQTESTWHAIGR